MNEFDRSSNLREERMQKALMALIPGVILILLAVVLFMYASGWTLGLRWIILLAGVVATAFGIKNLLDMKKIEVHKVTCPFCEGSNSFTEEPMSDVRCNKCNRQIPIVDGRVLKVWQVRCGFCNTLNYYSEKSIGLICEECDREIPISTEDDGRQASQAMHTYSRHDDDNAPSNLVLVEAGPKIEEMIPVLQKMLALNRNQVKEIIDQTPTVLLQGIPKKKAELLRTQIESHGGHAKAEVLE